MVHPASFMLWLNARAQLPTCLLSAVLNRVRKPWSIGVETSGAVPEWGGPHGAHNFL